MQALHRPFVRAAERYATTFAGALLLQLLVPGLGHFFRGEKLFGLFIYIIHILAIILLVISLFTGTSTLGLIALVSLPLAFYLFSLVDLRKVVARGGKAAALSGQAFSLFLVFGLFHQCFAPVGLLNMLWANRPELYRVESSGYAPYLSAGALVMANRLSFSFTSAAFKKTFIHELPSRYDYVRVVDSYGRRHTAIVIGLPGEKISMVNGTIVADDLFNPYDANSERIAGGDSDTRFVPGESILVGTLSAGIVDSLFDVSRDRVVGKVLRLL